MSRRHSRHDDDDARASSSSTTDYKELYREYKHDLKRKKREYEELEELYEKEKRETKKAKQDTQDLWKIYYTLQQELQQAYERTAKLSTENKELKAQNSEMSEKLEKETAGDCNKLREALCQMQKQKLEVQTQFNDIVLENKKLKEKEAQYEPRLADYESVKEKLVVCQATTAELAQKVEAVKTDVTLMGFNKEAVEKFQRWNSLLMLESEQKTRHIHRLQSLETNASRADEEIRALHETVAKMTKADYERFKHFHASLVALKQSIKQMRMDFVWTRDGLREDMTKALGALANACSGMGFISDKLLSMRDVLNQQQHILSTRDRLLSILSNLRTTMAVVIENSTNESGSETGSSSRDDSTLMDLDDAMAIVESWTSGSNKSLFTDEQRVQSLSNTASNSDFETIVPEQPKPTTGAVVEQSSDSHSVEASESRFYEKIVNAARSELGFPLQHNTGEQNALIENGVRENEQP